MSRPDPKSKKEKETFKFSCCCKAVDRNKAEMNG